MIIRNPTACLKDLQDRTSHGSSLSCPSAGPSPTRSIRSCPGSLRIIDLGRNFSFATFRSHLEGARFGTKTRATHCLNLEECSFPLLPHLLRWWEHENIVSPICFLGSVDPKRCFY